MGMFDYVNCERPLPDGWDLTNDHVGLQTKDFDCAMTTVKITADGRLMILDFEYEEVPKAERPYPDDDGIMGLCGSMRRINERWRDLNFHGVMTFGGLEDLRDDYWVPSERHQAGGFWQKRFREHDYTAKFTDGVLVIIETDAHTETPTSAAGIEGFEVGLVSRRTVPLLRITTPLRTLDRDRQHNRRRSEDDRGSF